MATPRFRARAALRIAFAGLLTASVCAFTPRLDGSSAVAGGLPREFLGYRLGERIDAIKVPAILGKLGVASREEAGRVAVKLGLDRPQ
jgi:hypothetical protein